MSSIRHVCQQTAHKKTEGHRPARKHRNIFSLSQRCKHDGRTMPLMKCGFRGCHSFTMTIHAWLRPSNLLERIQLKHSQQPQMQHGYQEEGAGNRWKYLHAPFEDSQWATSGKGLLGILQSQHTLTAVQSLVNVGMCLHLKACVLTGTDAHLQP